VGRFLLRVNLTKWGLLSEGFDFVTSHFPNVFPNFSHEWSDMGILRKLQWH